MKWNYWNIYVYMRKQKKANDLFYFDSFLFLFTSIHYILFAFIFSFRSARFLAKNNITMSQWLFFSPKESNCCSIYTSSLRIDTPVFLFFIADWNNGNGDLMNFNVGKKMDCVFCALVLPKLNRIYWPSMVIFRKVLSLNIIISFWTELKGQPKYGAVEVPKQEWWCN